MLLGQIVAKKRGMSFIEAVAKYVANPLALKRIRLSVGPLSGQAQDEARYTCVTMPVVHSVVDANQRLVPNGYGNANYAVDGPAGEISAAAVDMARVLAALNLPAADNPLLNPNEINAMFTAATATFTNTQGQVQGKRGHGWDSCNMESGGGFYAQKGGEWVNSQSCIRYSANGISMAVAWAHWEVNGDWYPNFPEVINTAEAADWGTTDLFPSFGMPKLT